jgi:transcriptional regulator with XRE-family HTH domain
MRIEMAPIKPSYLTADTVKIGRVSSGNRGAPISGLFARAEKKYPGIEEEVGLSSAALRAGELVRGMRKANGWTQTELADELGWDQVRISNIERGEGTRGPTFDVLTKIADACGFDLQFTPRAEASAGVEKREAYAEAAAAEPFYGEIVEPRPIEPPELFIRPSRPAESES